MLAVTMGPIPNWRTVPCPPPRMERNCPKTSWLPVPTPNSVTFVRKKYRTRIPAVQPSFRRNGT
jgi:hypothetical protein